MIEQTHTFIEYYVPFYEMAGLEDSEYIDTEKAPHDWRFLDPNGKYLSDSYQNQLLTDYIWPRYAESFICSSSVAGLLDPYMKTVRREMFSWLKDTSAKYEPLIQLYEEAKGTLMNGITNKTISRYNDTPQEKQYDGDNWSSKDYTTNISQTINETSGDTPIARLDEIRKHLNNLYSEWADDFRKFIIPTICI